MDNKVLKSVKNVLIGFFVIIFIFGFFSKSVKNLFLPKVQAVPVMKSTFSKSLKLEGVIEPKEVFKVRLNGGVIVEEYFVKAGQEVKKGDPVFRINQSYGVNGYYENIDNLQIDLEKKSTDLENLETNSYVIDEKNMEVMEENLENQKEEIKKLEKLYEAGAVAESQLEQLKKSVKDQELKLDISKLQLEEKKKKDAISIKELKNEIDQLKKKINEIKEKQKFYSKVADDGIYYSNIDGIVLSINQIDRVLGKDTVIAEIAKVSGYDSVILISYISEKDYYSLNNGSTIEIHSDHDYLPKKARVISIDKVVNDKMMRVEAEFEKEQTGIPVIGQKLKGKVVKKFKEDDTIPKAAVIPEEGFETGKKGRVYVVEEEDGVLGKEYIIKEASVTILKIGDNSVSVDGLQSFTKPSVVINISYKIKDGVKVTLWK